MAKKITSLLSFSNLNNSIFIALLLLFSGCINYSYATNWNRINLVQNRVKEIRVYEADSSGKKQLTEIHSISDSGNVVKETFFYFEVYGPDTAKATTLVHEYDTLNRRIKSVYHYDTVTIIYESIYVGKSKVKNITVNNNKTTVTTSYYQSLKNRTTYSDFKNGKRTFKSAVIKKDDHWLITAHNRVNGAWGLSSSTVKYCDSLGNEVKWSMTVYPKRPESRWTENGESIYNESGELIKSCFQYSGNNHKKNFCRYYEYVTR